ncbi:hypothetical protein D1632_09915 [Chryseobacterium nematophagum]|uniref:Uncharacterized protein n=1 Tax=Chryseobacterium nematophagum TaxID=2305228 RepID=A0A3M7LBJ4_9FLAO|nr:hypothetical protein [Chryseobacterium nematophagum]RMZ59907.1 hypothetical protein D1632_09915 [Chryseobacterium nematophagum]
MKKIFLVFSVLVSHLYWPQGANTEIRKNKTELLSELNESQKGFYNAAFLKFVEALKSSDQQMINTLISDKVKEIVTDNVIQKLSGGISF